MLDKNDISTALELIKEINYHRAEMANTMIDLKEILLEDEGKYYDPIEWINLRVPGSLFTMTLNSIKNELEKE